MKKILSILVASVIIISVYGNASYAEKPIDKVKDKCTTIQDWTLLYSVWHYLGNEPLVIGYDDYGYNYQAHMFNWTYANAYLGRPGDSFPPYTGDDESYLSENLDAENHWAWPYRNDSLSMKWNEAWLSNQDCDKDGKLDSHYGNSSYKDSGAWLTNHTSGEYEDENWDIQKWNEFYKIIAVSSDAEIIDGVWYTAEDEEIGSVIWGQFAIIQYIYNDTWTGDHWVLYRSPSWPGFGNIKFDLIEEEVNAV